MPQCGSAVAVPAVYSGGSGGGGGGGGGIGGSEPPSALEFN